MSTDKENQVGSFTIGQQIGMFIAVEGAMLSGLGIIFLVFYKLFLFTRRALRKRGAIEPQMDACDSSLFLSLLTGEMLRSIGASMSLRWILEGVITPNSFCTAQGFIKLIGTNAIDFSTLGITVHTFSILVLRWKAPRHIAKYFTAAVWLVVFLITTITYAVHPKDLMGPTGFWCWIMRKHKASQIMAEYLWMWIIGVVTAILYGVGFLVLRGYLDLEDGVRWTWRRNHNVSPYNHERGNDDEEQEVKKMANRLLIYPLVYLICITPQSFGRWFYFSHYEVPDEFTLFARTLFSLSGLFNVILFFNTRYDLIAGGPSTESIPATVRAEKHARVPSILTLGTINPHGRLPELGETTDSMAPVWGYDDSKEMIRGRKLDIIESREASPSAQRSARTYEDEDYGRLPM